MGWRALAIIRLGWGSDRAEQVKIAFTMMNGKIWNMDIAILLDCLECFIKICADDLLGGKSQKSGVPCIVS